MKKHDRKSEAEIPDDELPENEDSSDDEKSEEKTFSLENWLSSITNTEKNILKNEEVLSEVEMYVSLIKKQAVKPTTSGSSSTCVTENALESLERKLQNEPISDEEMKILEKNYESKILDRSISFKKQPTSCSKASSVERWQTAPSSSENLTSLEKIETPFTLLEKHIHLQCGKIIDHYFFAKGIPTTLQKEEPLQELRKAKITTMAFCIKRFFGSLDSVAPEFTLENLDKLTTMLIEEIDAKRLTIINIKFNIKEYFESRLQTLSQEQNNSNTLRP